MRYSILSIFFFLINFNSITDDNISLPCFGCHGTYGNSPGKTIPSISGLSEKYFIKSFTAYKNNIRENYLMRIIAKGYTEKQIISMSKYFNKQSSTNVE